jgi:teichuronic acid biosynthesis glycosyltransferase TuaC
MHDRTHTATVTVVSAVGETTIRVLAVIPGDGLGASFIFARRQVESLSRAGLDVKTLYLSCHHSPLALLSAYRRIRRSIANESPDIVHAHYGTITSFLCAFSTRKPLVITFRGSDLNLDSTIGFLRSRVGFFLSQLSVLRATSVVCTSSQLSERLWWGKNKVVILPSGVDLVLFQPREKSESRKLLGWPMDERVVILNVGCAPLLKGAPLARRVVELAEQDIGPLRLLELDGNVSPDKVPLYLNAADCLLLTSESEGSPNILKEALACNLPVVSVNVGDSALRLRGVWPSKVVSREALLLARALFEILNVAQRSNGRRSVSECSEQSIALILIDIYREVCDRLRIVRMHGEAAPSRDA